MKLDLDVVEMISDNQEAHWQSIKAGEVSIALRTNADSSKSIMSLVSSFLATTYQIRSDAFTLFA
jgi:hypothetical protein